MKASPPTPQDLLLRLLVTDFVRTLRPTAPDALRHLLIEHRALEGKCSILATRWRSDVNFRDSYTELSDLIAQELKLDELVDRFAAEDLLECMSFARIERRVIQDLKDRLIQQSAAALADIRIVEYRKFKRPFRAVCAVAGGATSDG